MFIKNIKRNIRHCYNTMYELIGNKVVAFNYKVTEEKDKDYIKVRTPLDFIDLMHYMDETNPQIQTMFGLNDVKQISDSKYCVNNKSINVLSKQTNNENWLAFIIDGIPKEFAFEFDYMQQAAFCEFQVAFNYESLLNRNRFIVMENKDILFDDISGGHFFKPLKSNFQSDSIFQNGTYNHVEIVCTKKYYAFYVNNVNVMTVSMKKRLHRKRGLAIILWENFNNRKIEANFDNFVISELKGIKI